MKQASVGIFGTIGTRLDAAVAGLRGRSFTSFARAWMRGDDVVDGQATRLTEPYAQSAIVHAAVNHVIGEIAGRPVKFYEGDVDLDDPALEAWWATPALGPRISAGLQPRLTQAQVRRDLAMWAKIEGEFFLLFDDSWELAGLRQNFSTLSPFVIAVPSRVRLIVQGGELQGYEYIDAGGRRSVYLPEQVYHWKAPNPYDDWRGVGDLRAASIPAQSAFFTGAYIRDLMRNNNDEGMIVIGKSGAADDTQRAQITAALNAKRAARRAGIAKDIFLDGGDMSIERPEQAAAGAELVSTLSISRQEVFLAFGVPPSMAEVKASYSIGKDSDYYQLITRTCIPLGAEIAAAFGTIASRMTRRALTGEMEWDDHPVMQEVRNSRIDTALKLWATGMAWQDINEYLDLGLQPFAGWETPYLPFSVAPVDTSGSTVSRQDPAQDPSLAEESRRAKNVTPDLPEIATLKLLLATRTRIKTQADSSAVASAKAEADALKGFMCGCGCETADKLVAQKADRPPSAIAQWRSHMKDRREQVKAFESRFSRWLIGVRGEVLRNLEAHAMKTVNPLDRSKVKAAAVDFLFDLAAATDSFKAAMRKQHTLALDAAGSQVYAELGKTDPFKFAAPDVLSFIQGRENKLAGIPQDVFARIQRTLQEGLDSGESTSDLAARVRAESNAIDKGRAAVIAQSETAAAYGFGRNEAMRKAGVAYKAWLTSGNSNVREAHLIAGETYSPDTPIPLDEPFVVDGEELMYPGDTRGSAGNVINCHCIQIAVAAPKET